MKRDIIIFMGMSSVGKDTIVSRCVEDFNWHKSVSYTSRPKRPNEVDGVDYFFRPYSEILSMIENGETYENTMYKTNMGDWLYAFGVDSFVDDNINLCIMNPIGLDQVLSTELIDRIAIVYIKTEDEIRFHRYNERFYGINSMTTEQKAEAYERLDRDYDDFDSFEHWLKFYSEIPSIVVHNNTEQDYDLAIELVYNFISEVNND
jgi:guanylate kinase